MDELEETYATQEEIPEAYRKLYKEGTAQDGSKHWIIAGVKGVIGQAGQKKLKDEAGAWRLKHQAASKDLTLWQGLGNYDEVKAAIDELPNLRIAADAGGGKSKEAVEKQVTERMAVEGQKHQRALGEKDKTIGVLQARVERFENAARTSYVLDAVRTAMSAFKGGKFAPSAMEDVLLYAERHFETESDHDSETGELVINGLRTKDKVGVTPGLEAAAWLAEMVARKPHWLEASDGVGGGPDGRRGNGGLSGNPWSLDGWNITEQAKYTQQHGLQKAQQMCKVAGAEWGSTRHPKASNQREQQRR